MADGRYRFRYIDEDEKNAMGILDDISHELKAFLNDVVGIKSEDAFSISEGEQPKYKALIKHCE